MDESPPTVAEEFAMALAVALYRKGLLDPSDIRAMSDELASKAKDARGDAAARLEAAAHLANCVALEAETEHVSEADFAADQARARFRVIEGGED